VRRPRHDAVALTGATVVHPFVHPFAHIGWHGVDPLDEPPLLSWSKVTERHLVDVPDRSLKVATRVRIPLGLQRGSATQVAWPKRYECAWRRSFSAGAGLDRGDRTRAGLDDGKRALSRWVIGDGESPSSLWLPVP
jgi:hypothetical protein